ncbi:multisubunit sodium/proton antiporter MrpA subunit /multisubunit sodium/proton antiporter MrpB subunit [Isoptericola sp. CG 20/1183]|uniref:Multisubunit sodium/proton antiporter MrpA subunit /multisubunit sodium/proton antiporter MrpB subunit n=1 Tax=Isoptericola halotolerans TaxID=300560 RepID=A0ABX5EIL1_9MICO|nr:MULTISPECIES: Na+/H+ antiporter subunit A [Isoptericola]PRZ09352.1 multisubunit sodium/proton antiporter MrpA subunit /multisubunit sodium/proton antiporter MrpB subunit [Isoptericola sp. CG 20/1183]PRZ10153.1 multisubunit sodium/proton antiporter MrpA subunit /multisubunit sodium/proton antiporter MrpB subunit [Isoptericola halotolerans]
MLPVLLLTFLLALAAPALVAWWGRRAFWVLALGPASAAAYALASTERVAAGDLPVSSTPWVPGLDLSIDLRLDTLSWLLLLVVGGVGALVLVYCSAYFSRDAEGTGRFAAVLTAFAGAMIGVVTADDLLLLFVFWELTTVFSYLLIGHYAERKTSRRAAMQAIVVTTGGGLAMLVGLVVLGVSTGTWRISEVVAAPPTGAAAVVATVCLIAGAATKAALVPFHFWLPAAMVAPTPVSAYLHAAAMVKAGVYLVARFAPGFAELAVWRWLVLLLGGGTLLLGGYRALRQHDLKLVLAFGTVSQLGLIVLLVGLESRALALAGLAMLGAHAMFKGALFLVAGAVDVATGTRDMRKLSGLWRTMPVAAAAAALATASMVGLPPFAGYVAKEAALEGLWHDATHGGGVVVVVALVAVVVGSVLTVAYSLRFLWGAFGTKPTAADGGAAEPTPVGRRSWLLVLPPLVLGLLGLAAGLTPSTGERLLGPYAASYPAGEPGHLVLWAGLTPALGLSVLVLAGGAVLFWQRRAVERLQGLAWSPRAADLVYRRSMRRLDDLAADVTGATQRGSLPVYLSIILVVLAMAPGAVIASGLLGGSTVVPAAVAWDRPAQAAVVAVVVAAAVLAARARRRLKAVVLVGVAGYGNAGLFLLHGAPDLALTQVLTETVTLVVLVLVLRRMPTYFSDRPLAASRWLRLVLAVVTGAVMMALTFAAPLARVAIPISVDFPEEAVEFGGGHNIVNVTLVDIRSWDTVGEISVILVAATGVASMVFLRQRSGELLRLSRADADGLGPDGHTRDVWIAAGRTVSPARRSVMFEVVTRLIFHAMIVVALFLLFSGHNAPGGGFAAGLMVGIALTVRYLAGGGYELGEALPVQPGVLLGSGLFLSAGVGLAALLTGNEVLESVIIDLTVPVLGKVHLVTSLFFDVGVMLVVVGLVLDLLRTLGAEIDRQSEQRSRPRSTEGVA